MDRRDELKSFIVRSALSLNAAWEEIAEGVNVNSTLARLPSLHLNLQKDCKALNEYEANEP